MNKNKRIFITMLFVIATVVSLTACGSNKKEDTSKSEKTEVTDNTKEEKVEISFLSKYPEAEFLAYFEGAVADYETANPNVKINMESVSDHAIKDKLSVMASANELPDVFFAWSGEYVKKFARAGLIADLTPYVEEDPEWSDAFLPAFLNNSTFDGHTYGIPYRSSALFMLYNKRIFNEYNLEEPTTWDQFLQVSEALKQNNITPISFGNSGTWYSTWWIGTLNTKLVSAEKLNTDYNPEEGEFTDPGYVEAIQHFIDLNDAGYFGENVNSKDYYQVREEFLAGMSGMIMDATSQFSAYSEGIDEFGFFLFPEIDEKKGATGYNTGGAEVYCVSEDSKHKDIAVDFIKFMTSKEQAIKQTAVSGLPNCIQGGITEENGSPELILGMDIISKKTTNVADWLDTAVDGRVADQYMTSTQEAFYGKSAQEVMEEVKKVAAEVKANIE